MRSMVWRIGHIAMVVSLVLGMSTSVLAGSNSTTLPNGAELSVSIDDPVTSTEFLVPPDQDAIDVGVSGTASIGLGEPDATLVYVMDVSGSTDTGSGTGCSPVLECERLFVKALNAAAISNGSVDEVGLAVYADSGATADMQPDAGDQLITAPDADNHVNTVVDSTFSAFGGNGGVAQFTNKVVGVQTNFAAGLQAAVDIVNASTNGTNIVVFLSDGVSTTGGGQFGAALDALDATGATAYAIATGTGSTCLGGTDGTLQEIADATGGACYEIEDPGNLPELIPQLIGSTLESLSISVDGGADTAIGNDEIEPDLPLPGAASATYNTTASGLNPDDHTICVTANGSTVQGDVGSVTQCETIHLLKLTASPAEETNELGEDDEHTVDATILGAASQVGDREVQFEVISGPNTGTADAINTNAAGQSSFTYNSPQNPSGLGTDTIKVSTVIADQETSVEVVKHWVDTTPPVAYCTPSVNPGGKHVPDAPGQGGQGQNQDGFYAVSATDDVWLVEDLEVYVTDTGSGTVFGPFASGTRIKYVEAPGSEPEIRPMGGNSATAVDWLIRGTGDAQVTAVDGSGNVSEPADCLVPPPPMAAGEENAENSVFLPATLVR
jgi:hypothetical protein